MPRTQRKGSIKEHYKSFVRECAHFRDGDEVGVDKPSHKQQSTMENTEDPKKSKLLLLSDSPYAVLSSNINTVVVRIGEQEVRVIVDQCTLQPQQEPTDGQSSMEYFADVVNQNSASSQRKIREDLSKLPIEIYILEQRRTKNNYQ